MRHAARLHARGWGADEMAARLTRLYREYATAAARPASLPAAQLP